MVPGGKETMRLADLTGVGEAWRHAGAARSVVLGRAEETRVAACGTPVCFVQMLEGL